MKCNPWNTYIIYECRCNERLKTKDEGSIQLAYTGLLGGLEHLKIMTSLRGGRFFFFLFLQKRKKKRKTEIAMFNILALSVLGDR